MMLDGPTDDPEGPGLRVLTAEISEPDGSGSIGIAAPRDVDDVEPPVVAIRRTPIATTTPATANSGAARSRPRPRRRGGRRWVKADSSVLCRPLTVVDAPAG